MCRYHRYSVPAADPADEPSDAHVIHAVGPDLRVSVGGAFGAPTRAEAVAALADAYRNIFAAFVASGQAELRLLPVSLGPPAGSFRDEFAAMTFEATSQALLRLSTAQQAAVRASETHLCIFSEADLEPFVAAGFEPSKAALEILHGNDRNGERSSASAMGAQTKVIDPSNQIPPLCLSAGGGRPLLRHAFVSKQANCPFLRDGGAEVVPRGERLPVDEAFHAAVPVGMELRPVVRHEERIVEDCRHSSLVGDGVRTGVVLALTPADGTDDWHEISAEPAVRGGRRVPVEQVEVLRVHMVAVQDLLNPRLESDPGSAARKTGSERDEKSRWFALARDPLLAEEHFAHAFGATQRNPEDGRVQNARKLVQRMVMEVWYLTVDVNQALRVRALWPHFQRSYLAEIQMGSFQKAANARDTEVYLAHPPVPEADWQRFSGHARREIRMLLNSLDASGHKALFGDFESTKENDAKRIRRGETFLDLVLYEDNRLTAEAVSMLPRQFNRRVELSMLVTEGSTLVLDVNDSHTVSLTGAVRRPFCTVSSSSVTCLVPCLVEQVMYVKNCKATLARYFGAFGDPEAASLTLRDDEELMGSGRLAW